MAEDSGEPKNREELFNYLRELQKPISIEQLQEILGSTVKHDDDNKAIAFLCMLLTYTEQDQTNIGFLAESSTGKSYIPLELAWYFPSDDLIKLGYASPQAFFYENGVLIPDPTDKRDVEDDKRRKIRVIYLHQKILIFMDQPHDQLLQRLRSLLSHDEKEIVSKMVNKREKSGNRTETVIIKGFSTVIHCTARFTMQDQEKTRLLLLSPEIDQEKLRESLVLKIEKESDRQQFAKRMEEDPKRKFVAARVANIRSARIKYVIIPTGFREQIYRQFSEQHKNLVPRHQRDISKLLSIVKGHALLNYATREKLEDPETKDTSIIANVKDIEVGFRLYNSVSEANELGLSPELYDIYKKMKPHIQESVNGLTRKELQKFYFQEFHKNIGREGLGNILKAWENVGLIIETPDPIDKRFLRYVCSDTGTNSDNEEHNDENTDSNRSDTPSANTHISDYSEDDS